MSKPSKTPERESANQVAAAQGAREAESKGRRAGAAGPSMALNALRKVFRAVFVDHLRLRREGPHLTIALAPAEPPAEAPLLPVVTAESPALRMQRALGDLLDARAGSRAVLKHLAALEQHLRAREGLFIHGLSISSLEIMLRQLHGLIAPSPSPGVALLMTELLNAVELKNRQEQVQAGALPISSFFVDHKLDVKELTPSALDEFGELASGHETRRSEAVEPQSPAFSSSP